MDLIYADKNKTDIGVLNDFKFDLAYGSGENDFELSVSTNNNVCREDYYIYIDGTEYGGIIDSLEIITESKTVKYKGRTFHGILDKKIISPNDGEDYYTASGDINVILNTLINRVGLQGLFKVSTSKTKTITYKFNRYVSVYKGILRMLTDNGYKLQMEYKDGYVELGAVPSGNYNEDTGLDSDRINFKIQKTYNVVNHLICLGKGELKNRTVVHLYVDQYGNIGTTQYYTGIEEITETFDYSSAESTEDLIRKGTERLREQNTNAIDLNLGAGYVFDVGDTITVTDVNTGIEVTRRIAKKIVTINKDKLKINYSVGE